MNHFENLRRTGRTIVERDGSLVEVRVMLVNGAGMVDEPYLHLNDAQIVAEAS